MPGLADRFKPTLRDRLDQSAKAKARNRRHAQRERPATAPTVAWEDTVRIFADAAPCFTITTSTNSGVTLADTWQVWADTGTTAGATWGAWTTGNAGAEQHVRAQIQLETRYRAEQQADAERWLRQSKIEAQAVDRSLELLRSCLTDEQRCCLGAKGYFLVRAPSGRTYRINHGTHGNVQVVHPETGRVLETLCIQPGGVPVGDSMLTQKLMLETAEDAFRRHANITLEGGRLVMGAGELLDGPKLAQIIQLRAA